MSRRPSVVNPSSAWNQVGAQRGWCDPQKPKADFSLHIPLRGHTFSVVLAGKSEFIGEPRDNNVLGVRSPRTDR